MIDNFFEVIFPGYKESVKPIIGPWETLRDIDRAIRSGFDTRAFESKCLTNSPFGDSFDVVLEDCPIDVLKEYKILILLGEIKAKPNLIRKLRAYVEGGGILIANTAQIDSSRQLQKLFGVRGKGEVKEGETSICHLCGKRFNESLYTYTKVEADKALIKATNEHGDILITSNKVGVALVSANFLPQGARSIAQKL